ncbi:MAG: ABC transporter substrate-binding protein [Gammaproteobacteria bacterium]
MQLVGFDFQMPVRRSTRVFIGVILLLLPALLWAGSDEQAKPRRIVSIGLCADQLLLMLAERSQIASLSSFATDTNMSYMAGAVGDIPLNDSSVEDVIPYQPDLVVGSNFAAWDTTRFLRQLGYEVKLLEPPTTVEGIYSMMRDFGQWTGNQDRAKRLIRDMKQKIAEIQSSYAGKPGKSIIIYSPNGYTIGANTLENEIMNLAGFRNLAAEMGIEGFQRISLERLIAAKPDILHIDTQVFNRDSLASAYIGHPVLKRAVAQRDQVFIPARLRICAGPMVTEAIEYLAQRR